MHVEIGKRYVVMSPTSHHVGSVVTVTRISDDGQIAFVQPDEGNAFKLSTLNSRFDPLRPATVNDEIRNLTDDEMDRFIDLIQAHNTPVPAALNLIEMARQA